MGFRYSLRTAAPLLLLLIPTRSFGQPAPDGMPTDASPSAPSAPSPAPTTNLTPGPTPLDPAPTPLPPPLPQATPSALPPEPASPKDAAAGPASPPEKEAKKAETHWYEKLKLGGYAQFRYNRLYASEDKLRFDGDKSVGANNGFMIRRARLTVQGDVSEILSVYLQADFAGATSGDTQHIAAIRDWYGDIFLDPSTKMFRLRLGQSKVPYGWENMQSSSNRLNLDRSEGLNSAWPGERELGALAYFETPHVRKLYKELVTSGLKGSGDYGIVGFGVLNGQSTNQPERNENRHLVARINYPFELGDQVLELGVYGYTGQVTLAKDATTVGDDRSIDQRVGGSVVLYPKPLGFAAEYNVGYGPERSGNRILRGRPLDGGYILVNARLFDGLFPFVRLARYDGGRKEQLNAPHQRVHEVEGGLEYTVLKSVRVTAAANYSHRETNDVLLKGTVVRTQVQLNY